MPQLPDEVLLDFDASAYRDWDQAAVDRLLVEQPDLYRNHLAIARGLEAYANAPTADRKWAEGHDEGLREVAMHLRQGELLPGGFLYEQWTSR
jgi:hypothetical protein